MNFIIKKTKQKVNSVYKSLYIKEDLAREIEKLAKAHDTSFNNIVISMIESCLDKKGKNRR